MCHPVTETTVNYMQQTTKLINYHQSGIMLEIAIYHVTIYVYKDNKGVRAPEVAYKLFCLAS